ncbi:transcriptional regulator [Paenibacillus sp. CCS19]|uniref:helix-turn-helix domain-containing protein n=1 Tax=Paenibacillus sp. CCS19 TaxID=3158387 RepID=UPI00256DD4D3|nr:XRE family transcriptional regulator [Paenibacillus cellulosilyticus]GMK40400.1 transcriptional regulator [Paenibacillus cellulosilyticus]
MEANKRFSQFVPARLIAAREARGLTLTDLEEIIEISHQAISKYEKSKAVPSFETLEKFSKVLHVPVAFFYKPVTVENQSVVFFRSKSMATQKSKNVHANKIVMMQEITNYLDQFLNFPVIDIPRVIERESYIPTDFNEIDSIASDLRAKWGLGNGPISHMVLLLEKKGAIIARSPFSSYSIDACSIWETNGRPYILLSDDKTSARSRFDIAHELGHLVLHSRLKKTEFNKKDIYKLIEKEANRFAASFLLPSSSFGTEVVSTSIDHFISLKKRWKVSIQMMAYRANSLGIFSDYQHVYIRQKLAKDNMLVNEPLDEELPFEETSLLKQAIEALVDNKVKTKQDIISDLCFSQDSVESITNVKRGYFSHDDTGKVIHLTFK